jgi:hypothetical protein
MLEGSTKARGQCRVSFLPEIKPCLRSDLVTSIKLDMVKKNISCSRIADVEDIVPI